MNGLLYAGEESTILHQFPAPVQTGEAQKSVALGVDISMLMLEHDRDGMIDYLSKKLLNKVTEGVFDAATINAELEWADIPGAARYMYTMDGARQLVFTYFSRQWFGKIKTATWNSTDVYRYDVMDRRNEPADCQSQTENHHVMWNARDQFVVGVQGQMWDEDKCTCYYFSVQTPDLHGHDVWNKKHERMMPTVRFRQRR